ncbi:MAG: NYN domain-containing protein, partial [Gemmataceae bacterium]|nr:NYN domain-containing protein [Gemmataceae bacterium]
MSTDYLDGTMSNGEPKAPSLLEAPRPMVNTAILVDFDSIDTRRLIGWIDRFQLENRLLIKRAYRDWTAGNHSTVQALMRAAIELIQVPVFNDRGNKNGVDIRLSIDAVEISLRKPHIERFIIFGSDSDYISLVIRLKEHNKEV